jgi:hypothetical protein
MLWAHVVLLVSVLPLYVAVLLTNDAEWFDGKGNMPKGMPKMGEAL